jgi:hypothetical protein
MLENKLDEHGVAPNSPIRPWRTSNPVHVLKKRRNYEGKYDPERAGIAVRIHGSTVHVISFNGSVLGVLWGSLCSARQLK